MNLLIINKKLWGSGKNCGKCWKSCKF